MSLPLSTTKFIKAGRSKNPFLLFFGNRKGNENERDKPLPNIFTGRLFALVIAALGICIYAFISGKLG
jgi:hypothetical protein